MFRLAALVLFSLIASLAVRAADTLVQDEARTNFGAQTWSIHSSRTVDGLGGFRPKTVALSKYGGRLDRKTSATGFFEVKKMGERWTFIDPDGYYYENLSVVAVNMGSSDAEKAAFPKKFSSKQDWADETASLLKSHGFNGTGAWSATDLMSEARVPYCPIWNFMSGYAKTVNKATTQPGHTGYPNDCILVFDPGFKDYCHSLASKIAATKNDPYLLGHFSDNELPFKTDALNRYLNLPTTDHGYQAAKAWMVKHYGADWTKSDITAQDQRDFMAYVMETYMQITTGALRAADPNHLCIGSRFYSSEKNIAECFEAAGRYLDVISINYYLSWSPDQKLMDNWGKWSGRPFIITEWYAMALDSGLPCTTGAGWVVHTQEARGHFYQNFALGLLENQNCVGFQWFMYMDNDPKNLNTDPSNRTSNKGIVKIDYSEWSTLLNAMSELNHNAYALIDFFDGVTTGGGTTPPPPPPPTGGNGGGTTPPPPPPPEVTVGSVTGFTLVDADTKQVIPGYDPIPANATLNLATLPTQKFNVYAKLKGNVASVKFGLDANGNYRVENNDPFALMGDDGIYEPTVGAHSISATPYTQDKAAGKVGVTLTLKINVIDVPPPPPLAITGFTLINADTDKPVSGFDPIKANATLELAKLPKHLNIRANYSGAVSSVRFDFDAKTNYHMENAAPFALGSDNAGNFYAWAVNGGKHKLTATPFDADNAKGNAGKAYTLNFTVVAPPVLVVATGKAKAVVK